MATDSEAHLDVCGVCCPLPLIELARAVQALGPGQTLEIVGNDPVFEATVRDFCQVNGHSILAVSQGADRRVVISIRVGG
ncbi:MAG: sulfurtransferase TusA family protein [Gallionellaceae bacterium]|nr:sulfurtransferase TusA family protein [Gallionellaceae bacterium]